MKVYIFHNKNALLLNCRNCWLRASWGPLLDARFSDFITYRLPTFSASAVRCSTIRFTKSR